MSLKGLRYFMEVTPIFILIKIRNLWRHYIVVCLKTAVETIVLELTPNDYALNSDRYA